MEPCSRQRPAQGWASLLILNQLQHRRPRVTLFKTATLLQLPYHTEDWPLTQNKPVNVLYSKLLCTTLLPHHSLVFAPHSFPSLFPRPERVSTISPLTSVPCHPPTPLLHLTASLPSSILLRSSVSGGRPHSPSNKAFKGCLVVVSVHLLMSIIRWDRVIARSSPKAARWVAAGKTRLCLFGLLMCRADQGPWVTTETSGWSRIHESRDGAACHAYHY